MNILEFKSCEYVQYIVAITIKESTCWEQMAITAMNREVIASEKWKTKGIEVEKKIRMVQMILSTITTKSE